MKTWQPIQFVVALTVITIVALIIHAIYLLSQ